MKPVPRIISIIIPAYKDSEFIKEKVANILELKYPREMVEIIFVIGGAAQEKIRIISAADPVIKIISMKERGKTAQLNRGLSHSFGDIIVQTDMDAEMTPNALDVINDSLIGDVAAVGLWCYPLPALPLERAYWFIMNNIRLWESRFSSVSHFAGPCFAYKKDLLPKGYPESVVADDVFAAFGAASAGLRAVFTDAAKVQETRNPKNAVSMLAHKSRKGNAFLRELLRFQFLIYKFPFKFKLIFLARLFQFKFICGLSYPFVQNDDKLRKVNNG